MKRFIGTLLAVSMILSSFGAIAFAKETDTDDTARATLLADAVRFVNETVSTNGDGLTPETPYKAMSSAINDLKASGGTIVVTATDDGKDEQSTLVSLGNTGDILITSEYGGVDYRTLGARLYIDNLQFGYVANPGKITLDKLNIVSKTWNNWHIHGHELEITESVSVTDSSGTAITNIQLLGLISTGGNYAGNALPDTHMTPMKVTIGNTNNTTFILGPCEDITIGNADITVNGSLETLAISNNTWANYDHGQLRINGDVTITVNGEVGRIYARDTETNDFSLEEFNGKLSVIVNHGGTYSGEPHDHLKMRAENWFVVRGVEGTVLSHGSRGGIICVAVDETLSDYTTVIFKNGTTGGSIAAEITDGTASAELLESGSYTIELSTISVVDVTLVDGDEETVTSALAGSSFTLPTLPDKDDATFEGWSETEDGEVKHLGGASVTLDAFITLYAVYKELSYPADVRFVSPETPVVSGNGRTPETPFKTLGQAARDLATSGGTIVIMGDFDSDAEKTPFEALNNTGELLITSVYDNVDYREAGAYLTVKQNDAFGVVDNPGKVTLDYINIESTVSATWAFCGHEVVLGKDCTMKLSDGTSPTMQLVGLASEGDAKIDRFPDVVEKPLKITVNNTGASTIIVAGREQVTLKEVDLKVNGKLAGGVSLSSNSYSKWWGASWLDEDLHFGKLIVDGDVKLTVNGTVPVISARMIYTSDSEYEYSLDKVTGNLGVIVNHGGRFERGIEPYIKEKVEGIWTVVHGVEGATLSYETEKANKLTLETEGDYNVVTLTNTTSENEYSFSVEDGKASITLTESGEYTVELSRLETFSVSFSDVGGEEIQPIIALSGDKVVLPTASNTEEYTFKGWAETEGGAVKYLGGETITVNGDITLYAVRVKVVYPDNVRFVNGSAARNGDGRSPSSPYIKMEFAASDLSKSGGTIVITGKTSEFSLKTEGDIVITSLYNGIDYRERGAQLYSSGSRIHFGYIDNPGSVTFENINVYSSEHDVWHLFGYNTHIKDTAKIYTLDGRNHSSVQLLLHATNDSQILPDSMPWDMSLTVDNENCTSMILGPREDLVTGGYDLTVNGKLSTIAVSNNTYESYYDDAWLETAKHFGRLTVDGNVRITINGSLTGQIRARKHQLTKETYDYGLEKITGDIGVIINHGGSFADGKIHDVIKERTQGKWFIIKGTEGAVLSYGDGGDDLILAVKDGYDYNLATITNTDTGVSYPFVAGEGKAKILIPESGNYTVALSKESLYGALYVTSPFDTIAPESYYARAEDTDSLTVKLPTLDAQDTHRFLGWSEDENAQTADFSGGESVTLSKIHTFYAVWEEIPTFTIEFKNDDGETIHTSRRYEGAPISFPSVKLYKYGKKLLGYAYEGETEVIPENATTIAENRVAYPVWGDIPAHETRIYVNGKDGNDGNDGTSPDKAIRTITKAVELLRTSGGYIIVTDGENNLANSKWNNSGNITLTSIDPASDIDYRAAEISEDGLTFKSGAYVKYGYIGFGDDNMTGKITIENLTMVNSANYMYLCFNGHPYEIGKGLRVYQKLDSSSALTPDKLCIRSLGESGSSKTNPEGIIFTLANPEVGTLRVSSIGKASNTVSGISLTVTNNYEGDLYIGNDSQGGTATVDGDVKMLFEGTVRNNLVSTTMTNPIIGNVYAIFNGGKGVSMDGIKTADGYGRYSLTTRSGMRAGYTDTAGRMEIVCDADQTSKYGYVTLTSDSGEIVEVAIIQDGKAYVTLEKAGYYTADFTDKALARLTLNSGCSEYTYSPLWKEIGTEVELPSGLYRYGYTFGGWTDGTTTYTEGRITMPETNKTLTAVWTDTPKHTVTFDANGSDITPPASISEYKGEQIVLERVSSKTTTFIGWSDDPDARSGSLTYTVNGDTTLYAITSTEPVYVIDTYYRGDPADYTGPRNSFRRYVIDVYLENAVASEGAFKLNTDNKFLYYLGHVPQSGITAEVTAPVRSTSSGTPGLQYFTTPDIEFKWTSEAPVDTTNGRIRIARIMMYFSSWGMGYDQIEKRTTDEIVSPFEGYTATAGEKAASVTANFYKGVKSDEVKVSGNVSLDGRDLGTGAVYDYARLYILDEAGDAVEYVPLESSDTSTTGFTFEREIAPGEYVVRVIKTGYASRDIPISITEATNLPEIVLLAGDTPDESGFGDGKINTDDFVRVLRGFSQTFPVEKYRYALDLNEDGRVTVSDLAVVKKAISRAKGEYRIITEVDTSEYKSGDWYYEVADGKISIKGGSEAAVSSAVEMIENQFMSSGSYSGPESLSHRREYKISEITNDGVSIGDYRIVIAEGDDVARTYAEYVRDYISELSGYVLDIVYDTEPEVSAEILIGGTTRAENLIESAEEYEVYELSGKLYVFYGDEQSAEMASLDLCEKILGLDSEGYDGNGKVEVKAGARFEGAWSVLSRFGVMSDSHIGTRYNWANYEWLYGVFDNFERVHEETPLDFIVSLGDNIDDGYANTYAADYAEYLEQIKHLEICDPVNPIDGRAEDKIPHYEICGNHDPIGGQLADSGDLKIRFFKNRLWYTENEKGEKVAYIAFFTDYGGYPLHEYTYSGSYQSYYSYGKVNDSMVKFVEDSIIEANAQGAKHIILYNHWGISQQVGSPMLPETGLGKIADVCEKYGIKLYFNGHEHDIPYSLRRYKEIYDYDASMTSKKHAVVEITSIRAKVTIYDTTTGKIFRQDIVPLSGRGEAVQRFFE